MVGVRAVDDTDDVIIITNDGVIIRINVADIPVQSRYAQGVRVMRVGEDSRIVTFARAPHEEEEESADEDKAQETAGEAADGPAVQTDAADAADQVIAHAQSVDMQEGENE